MTERRRAVLREAELRPILTITGGIARRTAFDENGLNFVEDEVTEETLPCEVCGRETERGWTCLDGGEFFCYDCVLYDDDDTEEASALAR